MLGIMPEVLLVLCFLPIVMILNGFMAVPVAEPKAVSVAVTVAVPVAVTAVPRMVVSGQQEPPLQDLPMERQNAGELIADDSSSGTEWMLDDGFMAGDGGCAHIPGEHTTIGAGHLLPSVSVVFVSIYVLAKQLLL